jgi:hypothetical protein
VCFVVKVFLRCRHSIGALRIATQIKRHLIFCVIPCSSVGNLSMEGEKMETGQLLITAVLVLVLLMFAWGRWRHDLLPCLRWCCARCWVWCRWNRLFPDLVTLQW